MHDRRDFGRALVGLASVTSLIGCRASGTRSPSGWDEQAFAMDLWRALTSNRSPQSNTALCPVGVAACLAMLEAGAKGATRREIVAGLRARSGDDVASQLGARAATWNVDGDPQIRMASALFAREGFAIEADYTRYVAERVHASARSIPAGARGQRAVNEWVAERTRDRITALISEPVPATMRAMLVNALHFAGKWQRPFDPAETRDGTFTRDDGTEVEAPMMGGSLELRTAYDGGEDGAGYYMIELPYGGSPQMDMMIVMPPRDTPASQWRQGLDLERVRGLLDLLEQDEPRSLITQIPKWSISSRASLIEPLRTMGVHEVFGAGANLSGVGPGPLSVDAFEQVVAVHVDESGTEAAAATYATISSRSRPASAIVDRPFWYVITVRGGPWLFLGQMMDPTQTS